ncbi:MAG: sialate O-acetylesterase [Bryobacteraceae bacterium]
MLAQLTTILTLVSGLADYQVLQRDANGSARAAITGTASAAGRLSCRIGEGAWQNIAELRPGDWRAELPPIAAGGPYMVRLRLEDAAGKTRAEIERREILVGDLWVLAGQSNMVGRAIIDESHTSHPLVRAFLQVGGWHVARDPLHEQRNGPKGTRLGAGLGLTFGKEMVRETGVPVGLIPCAQGGTSLEQWSPALASQGAASLYGNLLERVRLAGGRIAGVLWYQGENDSPPETAPTYGSRFEAFVPALRRDLGRPDLPFYYAQLSRYANPPAPYYENWNKIQEAQRLAESRIPGVRMVATIDLELGDPIHLGRPALERLGRRFARAVAGHGGPRVRDVYWASASEIRVRLEGAIGKIELGGPRVFGFEATSAGVPVALYYRAAADPSTGEIVLSVGSSRSLPEDLDLWYGHGLNPICNVVDGEDLALPAFGPWRIPPAPLAKP